MVYGGIAFRWGTQISLISFTKNRGFARSEVNTLDLALCLYGTETEKGQFENIFWNEKQVSNSTNFIKSRLVIFIGSTDLC